MTTGKGKFFIAFAENDNDTQPANNNGDEPFEIELTEEQSRKLFPGLDKKTPSKIDNNLLEIGLRLQNQNTHKEIVKTLFRQEIASFIWLLQFLDFEEKEIVEAKHLLLDNLIRTDYWTDANVIFTSMADTLRASVEIMLAERYHKEDRLRPVRGVMRIRNFEDEVNSTLAKLTASIYQDYYQSLPDSLTSLEENLPIQMPLADLLRIIFTMINTD